MSEIRAPDPTLTALDQRWDVVSIEEGLPPTAHEMDPADCDPADVFSRQPARDARWFAVPCRECFPDAPPPGHSLCSPDTCGGARGEHMDPDLAWQVHL